MRRLFRGSARRGVVIVRGAVAFAGGACVSSALGGACGALTSIPPPLMAATGLALLALCRGPDPAEGGTDRGCAAIVGIIAGLLLPSSPPPAAGGVRTSAAGSLLRGDLFETLDRLDDDPSRIVGHRVSVSGEWAPAAPHRSATVSRRVMSCCAADALAVGFDVELAHPARIAAGAWVRVDGVVRDRISDGERRFVLEHSTATSLDDRATDTR